MGTSLFRFTSIGIVLLGVLALDRGAPPPVDDAPRLRRPVAVALSGDGNRLFVAHRSGSISIIDTPTRRLMGEVSVGGRLADLSATRDGKLVAVDEAAGELIELTPGENGLKVLRRIAVAASPVCVRVDGERFYVASLWSRQVAVIEHGSHRSLEVPFPPRLLLPLPGGKKLLVADSFGGKLALVDVTGAKVEATHTLDAHAIRGLALRGDRVLLAHQVLVPRSPTTAEEMHWGNVLHQEVRSLQLAALLAPGSDALRGSDSRPLGEPGRGAGDPSGLAVASDGTIVVTLGGTGEIAFGTEKDAYWQRLEVGRRPTALALSPDGHRAYVADTSADAVVFVDLPGHKVEATVPLGVQLALNSEERGEQLFYDSRLSREGWMSCHSCHVDGHSNGGLSDTLSDGGFGAPKRVLSLLGVKDTGPWTWIGGSPDLAGQVHKSMQTTMRSLRVRDEQVRDLTAYLRTLTPPPPFRGPDKASVRRGQDVFDRQGCAKCHAPPTYTSPKTYDVGLHDEAGNLAFNPPSLRGVGQAGPYFHDGRATTLEEVFILHGHPGPSPVPRGEVEDLTNFLRSL
jgi:DNA-binding beta-propeller fold protein YncE